MKHQNSSAPDPIGSSKSVNCSLLGAPHLLRFEMAWWALLFSNKDSELELVLIYQKMAKASDTIWRLQRARVDDDDEVSNSERRSVWEKYVASAQGSHGYVHAHLRNVSVLY